LYRSLSLNDTKYSTVYFNAFDYDNYNEPLLSLVYSLVKDKHIDELSTVTDSSVNIKIKEIVKRITLGKADFTNISDSHSIIEIIKNKEEVFSKISELLGELHLEKADKMMIFIDELDRCRPDYAMKLLEEFKRLFKTKKVTFVFVMNDEQMKYIIENYYGQGFNSEKYLQKFISYNFSLVGPKKEDYLNYILNGTKSALSLTTHKECMNILNPSLRDINRLKIKFDRINISDDHFYNDYQKTLFYILTVYFIYVKIIEPVKFTRIVNGELNYAMNDLKKMDFNYGFYLSNTDNAEQIVKDIINRLFGIGSISDLQKLNSKISESDIILSHSYIGI